MDNNNDYKVEFVGDYKLKNYKLNIFKDNVLEKTVNIDKENYTIKNSDFKDKACTYTLEIVEDSVVLSTLNIYNLKSPITDIFITSPANGDMMDYDDRANVDNLIRIILGSSDIDDIVIKTKEFNIEYDIYDK